MIIRRLTGTLRKRTILRKAKDGRKKVHMTQMRMKQRWVQVAQASVLQTSE
jgi:hypothetical protein